MGILYIVPTPVGNMEDMTLRAIRILKEADIVLAEDTRTSSHLLKHFDIEQRLKWHSMRMEWANIPTTLSKFILLTIVFMYFRHYHQYFTRMTWIGRSLQYIGRRTLDIYLIHFLFMPNLPGVGNFFDANRNNFMMDITLSVLIGLVIIGFSIITSNILRISPFLRKYLFGK